MSTTAHPVSERAAQDEALRHGVALGDRDALWRLLQASPHRVPELAQPDWLQAGAAPGSAADEVVRGMFEMVANHLRSDDAQQAFAPFQLLLLLRGQPGPLQAFVQALDAPGEPPVHHLMLLGPGLFVAVADRLLRALTCAEVWPELGDLSLCQRQWAPEPLANQPQDPDRFQLAMRLAMVAALVVLYHELAHVLGGHCAYLAAQADGAGLGVLREGRPLAMAQADAPAVDLPRRAMEADADYRAGQFLARVLQLGLLGEVNDEDLPHWCELLAFVAAVTFNAFEAAASGPDYRSGYHLPATRTEVFLEGAAQQLGVREAAAFAEGASSALQFCAAHYQAPPSQAEIAADLAALQEQTLPAMKALRPQWAQWVPAAWMQRHAH